MEHVFSNQSFSTKRGHWDDIKNNVESVNPAFHALIEKLSPGNDFTLYELSFPYGAYVGDAKSQFIPVNKHNYLRLYDEGLPNEIKRELGYGKNSSPLGMILDKSVEWFVDMPQREMVDPTLVQNPGDFFCYNSVLQEKRQRNYNTNGVENVISGARSCFMLPRIKCKTSYRKMCSDIGISVKSPSDLYEHHNIFKSITNSDKISCDWNSKIIYFSQSWVDSIRNNHAWQDVKSYFYNISIEREAYKQAQKKLNYLYMDALSNISTDLDSYIIAIFNHTIDICMGESPGYIPATTENMLPLKTIQHAFIYNYKIRSNLPVIMQPCTYQYEDSTSPVYYSLQQKSAFSLLPKRKNNVSLNHLMKELVTPSFKNFKKEIIENILGFSGTSIKEGLNKTRIDFLHAYEHDTNSVISSDTRFNHNSVPGDFSNLSIPTDSSFFQGFIRFSKY